MQTSRTLRLLWIQALAALAVVVGLTLNAAPAGADIDADAARRIAADILDDDRYQTTLPADVTDTAATGSTSAFIDLRPVAEALGPVLKALFWVIMIAAAVLLLFFLSRELTSAYGGQLLWRQSGDDGQPAGPDGFSGSHEKATLADADLLAGDGDFAGAVRVLLFRSLEDLRGRIDEMRFPFLTSRELVNTSPLSELGRTALAGIVSAEEVSHFGGQAPDGEIYARCRQHYLAYVAEFGAP